jgi:2-polyprenyl-6-hydroxyphenyl methylase/3-demethylubiquinone-9 3-methyltransferase
MDNEDEQNDDHFYEYYAQESIGSSTYNRFVSIKKLVYSFLDMRNMASKTHKVLDVGCGAGTQCIMWAEDGHQVSGLDINVKLIELAMSRARESNLDIDYKVGTATRLPWEDDNFSICIAPELLEHVPDWEQCLDELARVTKDNGLIFISTNNVLCPVQKEFELPMYSWYPKKIKKYYEKIAVTKRPEIVNYAKYPAVNWFSYYSLRDALAKRGFSSYDRFDLANLNSQSVIKKMLIKSIRANPVIRWAAHVTTSYTAIIAIRDL